MSKVMLDTLTGNMRQYVEPVTKSKAVLTALLATDPKVQNAYKEACLSSLKGVVNKSATKAATLTADQLIKESALGRRSNFIGDIVGSANAANFAMGDIAALSTVLATTTRKFSEAFDRGRLNAFQLPVGMLQTINLIKNVNKFLCKHEATNTVEIIKKRFIKVLEITDKATGIRKKVSLLQADADQEILKALRASRRIEKVVLEKGKGDILAVLTAAGAKPVQKGMDTLVQHYKLLKVTLESEPAGGDDIVLDAFDLTGGMFGDANLTNKGRMAYTLTRTEAGVTKTAIITGVADFAEYKFDWAAAGELAPRVKSIEIEVTFDNDLFDNNVRILPPELIHVVGRLTEQTTLVISTHDRVEWEGENLYNLNYLESMYSSIDVIQEAAIDNFVIDQFDAVKTTAKHFGDAEKNKATAVNRNTQNTLTTFHKGTYNVIKPTEPGLLTEMDLRQKYTAEEVRKVNEALQIDFNSMGGIVTTLVAHPKVASMFGGAELKFDNAVEFSDYAGANLQVNIKEGTINGAPIRMVSTERHSAPDYVGKKGIATVVPFSTDPSQETFSFIQGLTILDEDGRYRQGGAWGQLPGIIYQNNFGFFPMQYAIGEIELVGADFVR